MKSAICLLLCAGLLTPPTLLADETSSGSTLYERRANLQQTLLAARQRYREWIAAQPLARTRISCAPWHATPSLPADAAEGLVWHDGRVDLATQLDDGQPLWSEPQGLVDGAASVFRAGADGAVAFLTRTIRATQPVRLTIGLGGGDRLEVWLNGQKAAHAQTHLVTGRYGCGEHVDGTRVNQLLVDLELREGANELVVRVTLGTEPSFYFNTAPEPTAWLWAQVRRDCAPQSNPLLEQIPVRWMHSDGWFAAGDATLEREFVEPRAADCGEQGEGVRSELERILEEEVVPDDARWLDLCVKVSVMTKLVAGTHALRQAVTELGRMFPHEYLQAEYLNQLSTYAQAIQAQAATRLDPSNAATRRLMDALPQMQREMLVDRNPLLERADICFVKRYTYNSKHYYDDFQHVSRWGGNLCVLSMADGQVRELVPQWREGVFDRYDIAFDASRIVFGYRRPQAEGFRIYEVQVDGGELRQVVPLPEDERQRVARYGRTSTGDSFYGLQGYRFWTDDVHPCYLPDGGICFASTRCEHGVLCTPNHYLACTNLFRVEADGSELRPLSQGALSEFTPTLMDDGRILYNRWEYVFKGIAAVQPLWTMRPDGSATEEFYGDNVTNPGVLWQARQVPGHPRLAVCIGCGHEPLGVGPVLMLNLDKNKRTPEPITSLTPDMRTESLRGLFHLRNGEWREDIYGPFYADPYPLSDKFLLVACNPDRRYNDPSAYGICLLDVFGNRVSIYRDPEISCWQPMLLTTRTKPPVLPSTDPEAVAAGEPKATVFMSDVYRGLEGVEPGTIKYLRIVEQIPKPWSAEVDPVRDEDRSADGFGGHLVVSYNSHIWVGVLHGIVPVEADGSACFEVPAGRNLFFQALDQDYMAVQRMRTFVNFAAGEQRSCIGCHEHRTQAPATRAALALNKPPAQPAALPGDTAPRPLYFPTDVQPILDQHCVGCHDGQDAQAEPDLRGELTTLFSRSYENLLQKGWVHKLQEWDGIEYSMQHAEVAPPYAHAAHASRLVKLLRSKHYEVTLSPAQWGKLVTWIDCGAPYYGSYFGRRHLMYQGQPDFRPIPTLESACGVPPATEQFVASDPIPARLLARWPLDGTSAGEVREATGQQPPARGVNVGRCAGPEGSEAAHFAGDGFVECRGLGTHEAISLALWVKPESLGNAWNPLLFCDEGNPGAVHFSLLPEGVPNVAINIGDWNWVHRRGQTSIADGNWHHLVLVCDARFGGCVRFYQDGQLVDDRRLSLTRPLDLYGFRIGGWNRWESVPANNFHGGIQDVRVYSGMLTDIQVQQLSSRRVE